MLNQLGFNKRIGEEQADRFWRTSFFNGMGEVPEAWCRTLEDLTGITGLRRLTLLPLRKRVGLQGCASATKRWCPHCLHDAEVCGKPYGQLLWEIGWVKACPKHGVLLEAFHGCPQTEAVRPLQIKRMPHICPTCARSLARPFEKDVVQADDHDVSFARTVGDLLAGPLFEGDPQSLERNIADFLKDMLLGFEGGYAMRAVRRLGVCKSDLSGWVHRKHLPNLPQAALIAETYRVSLSDVLVGKSGPLENIQPTTQKSRPISFRNYRLHTRVANLEVQLKQFIERPAPPSVSEAAGMLGTSPRELNRLYPGLAHSLAEKHAEWKSQDASRRREERLAVVKELINQMVSEGVIPTLARLEKRLVGIPKSFLFQERATCKRLCEAGKSSLGV